MMDFVDGLGDADVQERSKLWRYSNNCMSAFGACPSFGICNRNRNRMSKLSRLRSRVQALAFRIVYIT
jgi:hypothetical protein